MSRAAPRDESMATRSAPYARSWIDFLVERVDRLPGPAWLFYVLVTVVFLVVGTGLRWLDGTLAVGTFSAPRIAVDVLVVYGLAAVHRLKIVARDSLTTFRPALGAIEPSIDGLRYQLTTLNRRLGVIALIVSFLFTTSSIIGDPVAWDITPEASPGSVVFFIVEGYVETTFVLTLVFFVFRQMLVVVRIHRDATRIRLLENSARNGFSTLTLNLSVLVAFPIYLSAASYAIAGEFFRNVNVLDLVLIFVILITASLVFFIPLWGLHRRLLHEKARALSAIGVSFGATTQQLHDTIAASKFDQLSGVNTALSSLIIERDTVKRASTWPWEAETLRGFLTSVGLPILLWFVTTLLGRFLGA